MGRKIPESVATAYTRVRGRLVRNEPPVYPPATIVEEDVGDMRDDDATDDGKADNKSVVFAGKEGRAFRLLLEEFDRITASTGVAGQKPKAIFSRFAKAWKHGTAAGAWVREEVPGYGAEHPMYERAKDAVTIKVEARALGYITKAMARFSRAASYLGTSADLSEDIPTFEEFCLSEGAAQGSFVTAGTTMSAAAGNSDAGSEGICRQFDHKMYVAYVEHSEKIIFHNAYVYFREAAIAKLVWGGHHGGSSIL